MSSTEEARLRKFYAKWVVPAAEQLRARSLQFFPTGPQPEQATWYVPGPPAEGEFVEIEEQDCAGALEELWNRQGLPELAALARPLMKLGESLEVTQDETADVSPYIYVMY